MISISHLPSKIFGSHFRLIYIFFYFGYFCQVSLKFSPPNTPIRGSNSSIILNLFYRTNLITYNNSGLEILTAYIYIEKNT